MPQHAIGNFIRTRRRELGLTQEQLAERISADGEWLNQSDISRIETGKVKLPRPERLERIAEALGVSLGDLLASVVAVADDGQILLETSAVNQGQNGRAAGSAANVDATPSMSRSDDRPIPSTMQLGHRAHEAAEEMLETLIEHQEALLAALSGDERQHYSDLLAQLDRVVHRWAELLHATISFERIADAHPELTIADARPLDPASPSDGGFFRQLLDSVEQAVIVTSPDGTIRYWNRYAEKMYGWSADEALGRNVVDITPSAMSREQGKAIMQQLATGASWSGEFQVRRRDGTSFWAHVIDTPVRDAHGHLTAIIGVSHAVARTREHSPEGSSNDRDTASRLVMSR